MEKDRHRLKKKFLNYNLDFRVQPEPSVATYSI